MSLDINPSENHSSLCTEEDLKEFSNSEKSEKVTEQLDCLSPAKPGSLESKNNKSPVSFGKDSSQKLYSLN